MILLVSAHFPPEPVTAATLCYDLAVALSKQADVQVITPKPTRPLGFQFHKNNSHNGEVNHLILKSFTHPKSSFSGRMLESISFGRHAADYIHRHHKSIQAIYVLAWPLFAQYQIVKMAKKYAIPAITHVMDIYPESLVNKLPLLKTTLFKLLLPLDKYILQNSSKVITISANMKATLVRTRKLVEENVEVIHNWQNDDLFIQFNHRNEGVNKNRKDSPFTFMFLGCLSKSAALEYLIRAYKLSQLPHARLVLAGSGSEKEYLTSLVKGDGQGRIEFWDAPMDRVPEIQNNADVLFLGLRKNTALLAMPSKLPAYMFSKKPIIASVEASSATAKAIINAKCGWTVEPENPAQLGELLKEVYAISQDGLAEFGMNGYVYANKNFSRKSNLQSLTKVITDTIL